MNKVAIIGASGFVGSTLVEMLQESGEWTVLPIIHSSGNAWRLARLGLKLAQVDLLSREQLCESLRGCTHVVNCSRGENPVMLKGLENLLSASRQAGVTRFVHLGSVAVYGDPPPVESAAEDAPTRPEKESYGWMKLKQDAQVHAAANAGLSSVILCPPNIIGPYSAYLLEILEILRGGRFMLLSRGETVCCTVDVRNLCHAITLSLQRGPRDGSRLFVTDDGPVLWREVISELRLLYPKVPEPMDIERSDLERARNSGGDSDSNPFKAMKHLVSSDVREALRKDPILAGMDQQIRGLVSLLGKGVEQKLRSAIEGPLPVPTAMGTSSAVPRVCLQQLRGVQHKSTRAFSEIGYKPVVSFQESIAAFRTWYEYLHGWHTSFRDLIQAAD
jgi:nucleoside-diphosphate-sugar epimerase